MSKNVQRQLGTRLAKKSTNVLASLGSALPLSRLTTLAQTELRAQSLEGSYCLCQPMLEPQVCVDLADMQT